MNNTTCTPSAYDLLKQEINPFAKQMKIKLKQKSGMKIDEKDFISEDGEKIVTISEEKIYLDNAFFIKIFEEAIFQLVDLDRSALNLLLWVLNELKIQLTETRTSKQPGKQMLLLMTPTLCKNITHNGKSVSIQMTEKTFYKSKNELVKRGILAIKDEGYVWINPNYFFSGKRENYAKCIKADFDNICSNIKNEETLNELQSEFLPEVITPAKKVTKKSIIKPDDETTDCENSIVTTKTEYTPEINVLINDKIDHSKPLAITQQHIKLKNIKIEFDENDISKAFEEISFSDENKNNRLNENNDSPFANIASFSDIETHNTKSFTTKILVC